MTPMSVGVTADEEPAIQDATHRPGADPADAPGAFRPPMAAGGYSSVWGRPPADGAITAEADRELSEGNLRRAGASRSDEVLLDAIVGVASRPRSVAIESRPTRDLAETILKQ